MTKITFNAQLREKAGKGAARACRREGRIPAVIYGNKQDSLLISLHPVELEKALDMADFYKADIEIVVDGKTLTLSLDCRILCAESSGQVGQYQLSDLLIVNGRGYGMAASYAFSAVYGKNSQGQVEWLMILRSKW